MLYSTAQQLFLEQMQKVSGESPVLQNLSSVFKHYQEKILQMQKEMPPDEILVAFIGNVFGIFGGGSMEDGWFEYAGGSNPRIVIKNKDFVILQKLEGQQLVVAFRNIFNIPANGQLNLF